MNESNPMRLHELLRSHREKAGLTIEQAASALKVKPGTIRSWEADPDNKNYRRPDNEAMKRVVDRYRVRDAGTLMKAFLSAPPSAGPHRTDGAAPAEA